MTKTNSHGPSSRPKSKYHCKTCKLTLSNYGELRCHSCPGANLGAWRNLSFNCLFCSQSAIPSAFRLMVHLRKAHNACEFCLETHQNQESLALHVNKHDSKHACFKCNITYPTKRDIFEHLFWKHNNDGKVCSSCFTKKWPSTYHFCVPPAIFSCDECNVTFTFLQQLRVHMRWHTGNIPYECNTCHGKFISKKLLQKHKILHGKIRNSYKKTDILPLLDLSSGSDTEETVHDKLETTNSIGTNANDYWDYIGQQREQRKKLVRNALYALRLDHAYTVLPQSEIIKSPLNYPDELTNIVNGNAIVLSNKSPNNSFNRKSPSSDSSFSSSFSGSSSSSSFSGSSSSSCSSCSSSNSDTIEKNRTTGSPKKNQKEIRFFNVKKIRNFNLYAHESDLESELSSTDDEDYFDINPVILYPTCVVGSS